LDLALELGFDAGGWVPKGRLAEDGPLAERYNVMETPSDDPVQRTDWDVRDSAATLLLSEDDRTGGSALTAKIAERLGRPWFHADLGAKPGSELVDEIVAWLTIARFRILNVAGLRLSKRT